VDGNRGEFTVLVDGKPVAKKGLLSKPSVEKVVQAVRDATPAHANGELEVSAIVDKVHRENSVPGGAFLRSRRAR